MPEELDTNRAAECRRESWTSLHEFYESDKYGQGEHFRFRYIVKRLLDSPTSEHFTIGVAFLLPYEGQKDENHRKSLDELHSEHAAYSQGCASVGRGLYFTNGPYGVRLDEVPHVVVYTSIDGETLFAQYCRGLEIVSSHMCQARKEIPCILSLLKLLQDECEQTSDTPE